MNSEIYFHQSKDSYGHFAKVNPAEFKRLISNLINNAIEALPKKTGIVKIDLKAKLDKTVVILIEDNGAGIPKDLLSKIGFRGATFNKSGGSGLGLFGAKELIQQWGGELTIESQEARGTKVCVSLPKSEQPDWFVPKLSVKRKAGVIAFDDDQTIHQIWKGRFESLNIKGEGVSLHHFSSPTQLRQFYGENFAELDGDLFLMDYEIIGSNETGLDLIEQLGIQSQSVLVTSRYEEESIRTRCIQQHIKILPKSMSGFVPIEFI